MTRRGTPVPPQPPWVWGPTEVREWIRGAYPSKRHRAQSVREGPEIITRLRIVAEGSDAEQVRAATENALDSVGLTLWASEVEGARHRVVAVLRRSLVGERLHVSLRFTPPIHVSSCKQIVARLGEEVRILGVSIREERARLPAKRH
ncbi:MAG TPA: hypothetical protein VI999_05405 [Thermoplasmata archaeon]|nr:hypothetical protein [Thermoplasmata archaeon]